MRKHNVKFARRITRHAWDRTNFPQDRLHKLVHDKTFQLGANGLLAKLFVRVGLLKAKEVAHA